jgi:prepilin-type N-terminal cleavage/methylation domain-containing protein
MSQSLAHHRAARSLRLRRRQSGVTLMELLIAIVILTVGLLAALGFMTTALANSLNSNKLLIARNLAEDTMNQIFIMREMNAIGGIPSIQSRNVSTYDALNNVGVQRGIFPTTFLPVRQNIGPDRIRATTDDTGPADPEFQQYMIRVVVRSAVAPCAGDEYDPTSDPLACPVPGTGDQLKRVIVQVQYPFGRAGGVRTIRLETFVTVPPAQFTV